MDIAQKTPSVSANSHASYIFIYFYAPSSVKLKRRYTGFTLSVCQSVCPSVRLSICGQNRACSVSSAILVRSIPYLHILSSNFRRCVSCKVCFNIKIFGKFFNFVSFTLSSFHLGSYDSIVWVIMRGWVSSECRHSSCCSLFRQNIFIVKFHVH